MTNPVILYGTQSNGETLPVQVDATGRLVAEGLPGPEGQPGPPGPEGPPGSSLDLPPDPWEGALLGWLNGELSWIGTPPVPVPEGAFGPITNWEAESGLLEVEGGVPESVGNGVYVYQCDEQGNYWTDGWDVRHQWSDTFTSSNGFHNTRPKGGAFDGDVEQYAASNDSQGLLKFISPVPFPAGSVVELMGSPNGTKGMTGKINGGNTKTVAPGIVWTQMPYSPAELAEAFEITMVAEGSSSNSNWGGIRVDGKTLVDTTNSLSMRVNSVLDNALIGVPRGKADFTVGKFLKVPSQRVAPWVLYGSDPTSLIDHLRRTRD